MSMLNHCLLEDQEISSQMGFQTQASSSPSTPPTNWIFPPSSYQHPSLKTSLGGVVDVTSYLMSHTYSPLMTRDVTSHLADLEAPSLLRSRNNLWPWGEVSSSNRNHIGVASMKIKKVNTRRKLREPRFCFKTMSDIDVMDDGYKWRKYGQKVVKNTQHPRSYYRCTQDNCRVKKRVERLAEDPRMVITTYEGRHAHSPSHDPDSSLPSSQTNSFFW